MDMYAVNWVPPTLLHVSLMHREIIQIRAIPATKYWPIRYIVMTNVFPHMGSRKAKVAFARASTKNETIATLRIPNLSPRIPPIICPETEPSKAIPPTIPLYFCWDQPASLMKMST